MINIPITPGLNIPKEYISFPIYQRPVKPQQEKCTERGKVRKKLKKKSATHQYIEVDF